MLIFELLDQYEGICRRDFFGCAAKLNKTFKANIIEILMQKIRLVIHYLPRRRTPTVFLNRHHCPWQGYL